MVADAIMSLDNVFAISAVAEGNVTLIVLGLALSIPFVVLGASLLVRLLARLPVLAWLGGALLGWLGGQMIGDDTGMAPLLTSGEWMKAGLEAACLAVVVLFSLLKRRRTTN
jgi:predicted tellurium resistance membrane protein TerC